MRPLILAALLAPWLLAAAAQAQISVFASVNLTDYGFYPNDSTPFYSKGDGGGVAGGMFYNFHKDSRLTLGIGSRGSYSPGSQGGGYVAESFRLGLVPDHSPLRPYFETGLGITTASTNAQTVGIVSSGSHTSLGEILLFGLDVRLTDSFDLRALELGGVAGGSVGTGIVDCGVVYHLRPLGRAHKP